MDGTQLLGEYSRSNRSSGQWRQDSLSEGGLVTWLHFDRARALSGSGCAQNTNFGGLKEDFIGINRDPRRSRGTLVGFLIPGIEQARKKIIPIHVRDSSTEEFGDFVRGGTF